MKERLIELLNKKYDHFCDQCGVNKDSHYVENLADYLLENGVIVPPCKVGDKVWEIEYSVGSYELWETRPLETEVKAVCILTENDYYKIDSIGKDVFLTYEEAQKALRKEDEGK